MFGLLSVPHQAFTREALGFSHFHIRVFDPHLELLDMLLRCLQACARRGQYLARAALPAIGRGHVDVRDVLGQQGCLLQARLHPRSWNRYLEGRRRFDLPQQGLAVRKDGLEIIARLDHFFLWVSVSGFLFFAAASGVSCCSGLIFFGGL